MTLLDDISVKVHLLIRVILSISLLFVNCDDNKKDEPDIERVQWLYLYFTNPTDVRGSCLGAIGTAINCADTAGGAAHSTYVGTLNSIYTLSLALTAVATDVCDVLPDSPNYPVPGDTETTYSAGAKICFFDCEKDFWQRHDDAGHCNSTDFSNLLTQKDDIYDGCLKVCFERGTLLPQ